VFKRTSIAAAGAVALALSASTATGAARHRTLYVSPKGNNAHLTCTKAAPCRTIGFAVGAAKRGDTVVVEKGTYRQRVVINKDIRVIGVGHPVNDLKDRNNNGFVIQGRKAAGAVLSGFVVEHAVFEGIVIEKTAHVTVSNNIVRHNDLGAGVKGATGECMASGEIPGDCGEGIHLYGGVRDSTIKGNLVTGNTGGILLSDEFGPTAGNLITRNTVRGNLADCGITVVGHNAHALSTSGKRQPRVAGVFGNTISKNVVNGNGTKGNGGGILLAAGPPGTAVYDNLVRNNTANGNGLAGITLHSHAPGQDLNGNMFKGNKLSHDGLDDTSESEFGLSDGKSNVTVGILIGSGFTKLSGIVVTGNVISNTHYGIFTKNAPTISPTANTFHNVAVPLQQT
jgi:parallel beta-helix repeat protein